MTRSHLTRGSLAIAALLLASAPLEAQQRPLAPVPARGLSVAPFFEGWFANPDGTYTLSFGYFNFNMEELIEIPVGPDNFLEPAELGGFQPTSFPPRRERGVFTVTIPAEFRGRDVVWTLRSAGETHSVPGRVRSPAYELGYEPMAMGSLPPVLRFDAEGEEWRGLDGRIAEPLVATIGVPLPLEIRAEDRSLRESPVALRAAWFKHQGPGPVEFDPDGGEIEDQGVAATSATFSEPGEYVLRVRVDNFAAPDSSPGDQCCWSNGYYRVTVTP
jgi:hypothetical protein